MEQSTAKPNSTTLTITHPMGLHLRRGKDMVHLTNKFQARITAQNMTRQSAEVDAKSILQLMQLQARQGHILCVRAQGPDAREAIYALQALFNPATSLK